MRSRLPLAFTVVAWVTSSSLALSAEDFPSSAIRIVSAFSASTPVDVVSRLIAAELGESPGWRVVVDDRPGAIGTIAGGEVLRQPADGTSIYPLTAPVTAAPAPLK